MEKQKITTVENSVYTFSDISMTKNERQNVDFQLFKEMKGSRTSPSE